MKTKAQILKDNGLDIRLTSVDDLRAISFAMDEYAASFRPEVVVPSEEWIVSKIKKGAFYSFEPTYNQGLKIGWNEHKEQLKSLNPTLTFTELNHTEK